MKKLINKLKIPILAGAFVLFSSSDPNKNKAEDIKVLPSSGAIYYLSREEAEKGIRGLAKTDSLEDAWIYHDSVLIDVGYNISKDSVLIDWSEIVLNTFYSKDTIYLNHHHPFKSGNQRVSPPSRGDFFCDKFLKNHVLLKDKPIISKAFDYSGEWIYSSNSSLDNLNEIEESDKRLSISRAHIDAFPRKERRKKDIEFFIKRMEDLGLKVKYKKLE